MNAKPAPTPDEVIAFLKGANNIDGVSFGELHPKFIGRYWWRNYLLPILEQAMLAQRDGGQ